MDENVRERGLEASAASVGEPAARQFAGGSGWSIGEYVCRAGPHDRTFEERHNAVSMAAVVAGSFSYASDAGRGLMHPGALLLGNHGACYQCRHDHGVGDRCISVQFSPDYFAEVAATAAESSKFRFPAAMLPAGRAMLPHTVMLEAKSLARDVLHLEEHLVHFVAAAVRALSGAGAAVLRPSAQDARRVSRTLRHIEQHAEDALDLDQLATVAATSKFHFLRIFQRTVGITPHQFVLSIRLRRAATRLLVSTETVSKIAFDCGFGDLSTFNATFRARFEMSPMAFRQRQSPA